MTPEAGDDREGTWWHRVDVKQANDHDLMRARRQLIICIECGPGPTSLQRVEAKLREVNDELTYRMHNVRAAEERIKVSADSRLRVKALRDTVEQLRQWTTKETQTREEVLARDSAIVGGVPYLIICVDKVLAVIDIDIEQIKARTPKKPDRRAAPRDTGKRRLDDKRRARLRR